MRLQRPTTGAVLALAAALLLALLVSAVPARATPRPLEGFASYQPQTNCSPRPKPGTVALANWLIHRYGGGFGGISRPCSDGGTSEHKEGRAFDWTLDATKPADRRRAQAFLHDAFAADADGNPDALARRMGIMYLIWNDHIYSAYRGFAPEPYLDSSCKRVATCSPVLRHRTHMHISLTRRGGRGLTSWYVGRVTR